MTDRQKVSAWLDHINCTDEAERADVMQQCTGSQEAREFYVMKEKQAAENG